MAKPELGTKRLCGACGAKFYDLSKDPIVCPKCGSIYEVIVPVSRARPEAAVSRPASSPVAIKNAEPETVEVQETELVSLEDADAEAQGKTKRPAAENAADTDDDIEVDDENLDDAAFIEEEEEGNADVTDIIGDGIEKEEET